MKPLFRPKILIAVAVAVAALASPTVRAQAQPSPAPTAEADNGAPADIVPGSPLADVVKMIQAGVDANTIKSYIFNCQNPFNLDADKVIYLKDMGAPSDLINAMIDRDKALYAANVAPQPQPAQQAPPPPEQAPAPEPVAAPAPAPDAAMAPPPAPVTVNYFNDTLTPYGAWVDVDGYGRCWRPTAVIYNTTWSPYCDNGHWVYTDDGWYWDSDYSWGVTFHYGRWFRNPRFGWCWYPDTVWAPSWVAWRSGDEYCGWAPLPPFAVCRPEGGFFYRGVSVGVDFDFGLGADCFVFVSPGHFCERHPRSFCVPRERVVEVYHHTTIINHYEVRDHTIVNRGFGVDRIASASHRQIEPVHVNAIANAGRQGYRGPGFERTLRSNPVSHTGQGNNNFGHTGQNDNPGAGHNNFNGNNIPGRNNNPAANNNAGHNGFNNNNGGSTPAHTVGNATQTGNGTTVRRQNSIQAAPGGQGMQVDAHRADGRTQVQNPQAGAGQIQSRPYVTQPQVQQPAPQIKSYNGSYNGPGPATSQNQIHQNQWQQGQNVGSAAAIGAEQHGASQLQNRQPVIEERARRDVPQNVGGPQGGSQGQPQVRATGNPGGANNNPNNGSNRGSNRQNQ